MKKRKKEILMKSLFESCQRINIYLNVSYKRNAKIWKKNIENKVYVCTNQQLKQSSIKRKIKIIPMMKDYHQKRLNVQYIQQYLLILLPEVIKTIILKYYGNYRVKKKHL